MGLLTNLVALNVARTAYSASGSVDELSSSVYTVNKNMEAVAEYLDELNEKLQGIEARLDNIGKAEKNAAAKLDKRLQKIEVRLDKKADKTAATRLDNRLQKIEPRLDKKAEKNAARLDKRLEKIESRLDKIEKVGKPASTAAKKPMLVTAWNNGKHSESGAGYGIKINIEDRDKYFKKEWTFINLSLQDYPKSVKVNVSKPSFWNESCRELIKKEIGTWMINNGDAPWEDGKPPKFRMEHLSENNFSLYL